VKRFLLSPSGPRADRRARPAVLALEDRLVPAAPTEMTQLAQLFPRHPGPTTLYVNFDGRASEHVAPFASVSGDRDQDIQDILFRTAEIFSPFDVQVVRLFGDGNYSASNGDTTVFVGDDSDNGTGTSNRSHSFASADNSDFPGNYKGYFHQPNSDSYDVAYVDPVAFDPTIMGLKSRTPEQISQSIAHEAGHTFGLGHVLNAAGGALPDIMNYDPDVPNERFVDSPMSLTDLNNPGNGVNEHDDDVIPKWNILVGAGMFSFYVPYRMQTQDSFTYLQAALGPRAADDFPNVAHDATVDHSGGLPPVIGRGSSVTGRIDRPGDYDVFDVLTTTTQGLTINVMRAPGMATFNPVVMVYEGTGLQDLGAFNNNRTATDGYCQVFHVFGAGLHRIVVGAANGNTAGSYVLALTAPGDPNPNPDHDGPRVVSTWLSYTQKTGVPTSLTVMFNEDIDPATFTAADVTFTNASGVVRHPSSVTMLTTREFVIPRGSLPLGEYTLKIGPDVRDFAGNEMNQDGDAVNGEVTQDAYTELLTLEALGQDPPGATKTRHTV
jgi:hypothetical protein